MDGLAKPFDLLVTHVSKFHGLVKIFGQTDHETGKVVDKYLSGIRDQLESGQPASATQISPAQSVIVRHDGVWRRAKVNTVSGIKVSVTLVDTGEVEVCNLTNIRTVIHAQLQSIPPLAQEFVLGEVVPPAGDWSKPSIEFVRDSLHQDICKAAVIHRSHGYNFIRVFKRDSREPLVEDMVQCGMAVSGYPNMDSIPPADNFYPPPQLSVPPMLQYRGPPSPNYPPPTSPRPLQHPPQQAGQQRTSPWNEGSNSRQFVASQTSPVPRNNQGFGGSNSNLMVRTLTLETGTWYPVYISAIDEGPNLFHVQLESLTKKLEEIMSAINSLPLNPIPPTQIEAGRPCLARYSVDKNIYRAIILQRTDKAKVLYLDYGNKETVPLNEIYELPESFRSTQMLSIPCSLYQWPDLQGASVEMAKQKLETYSDRSLNCRVMSIKQEGTIGCRNIVQLYEDALDIGQELRLWIAKQQGGKPTGSDQIVGQSWSQGSNMQITRGTFSYSQVELVGTVDVYLSYHGRGPSLFYVQRADTTKQIQQIMREIASLVKSGPAPLTETRPGSVCLAQYNDGVWYRGRVEACRTKAGQIKVEFVDFGNSDIVRLDQVAAIPPALVTCLPAQAVPCKLAGNYGTQSENLVKRFLEIVRDDIFRIKVEKVLSNVCMVQASTTVPPLVNINSELSNLVPNLALTPSMGDGPLQLLVTHFENSNSFYGQQSSKGTELAIFLANLAEYCSRLGTRLYSGFESHVGEVCATVDGTQGNFRYYRCKVVREQRNTVDLLFLDVGGMERVDRSSLVALPEELKNQPEFGFRCSLGYSVPIVDPRLSKLCLDNFIEVVKIESSGETNVVKLTQNNSSNIKNSLILRFLKDFSPPACKPASEPFSSDQQKRLTDLYNRQNNIARPGQGRIQSVNGGGFHDHEDEDLLRRGQHRFGSEREHRHDDGKSRDVDQRYEEDEYRGRGTGSRQQQRKFERGDLRNSLRERRAAREITLAKPVTSAYKYPRLQNGQKFSGKITWMFDPGHFYVQAIEEEGGEFSKIMDNMQMEFRSGPFEPKTWTKGAPIAAKYQDGCWYRAKALGQRGKLVDVYFVDFGNTDKVDAIDVLALPAEFGGLETQALKCSLVGLEELQGKWDKLPSGFAKYFVDTDFLVEIVKAGRNSLVDLNNGQIVAEMLRDYHEGVPKNRGEERLRKNRNKKEKDTSVEVDKNPQKLGGKKESSPKDSTKSGKVFRVGNYPEVDPKEFLLNSRSVLVSHYNSWKELWVQVDQERIQDLTKQMNDTKSLQGAAPDTLQAGDSCIGSWNDLWYRVTVLNVSEDKVEVHFVDYGNTEDLPLTELRSGDPALFTDPPAALRCKLDVKMTNLDKVLEKSDYSLNIKFKSFFKNQFVIKLEKEKKEKKNGRAKKGEKGVSLTYLESVRRMWFVSEENLDQLNVMMQELAEVKESLVPAASHEDNQLYAVRYSEDGEMYRARVIDRTEDGVEVEFVDYGNQELVEEEELMELPEKFKSTPGFAQVVDLKGAEYALDCEEIKESLEDYLSEASVRVNMGSKQSCEGTLIVDGKPLNLSQWLRYKEAASFNLFRHLGTVRMDCYVSNTEPLGQVWIIEKGMLELLERMMQDLQGKAKGFRELKKVKVGRLACAKFSQDGDFYRVQILDVKGESADIQYIDFGNRETLSVNELLELSKEFTLHPGFAMKVEIDSKGDCRMLAPGEMESIISQGNKITVELVQPRQSIVRIYLDGQRVGYKPPEEAGISSMVAMSPARLRLGCERLGVFTMVAASSFAVQDVFYASKIEEKLKRFDMVRVDLDDIVVGGVYVHADGDRLRRLVVDQLDQQQGLVKYIDTQSSQHIRLTDVFKCPGTIEALPPAAVTAASMTASTKDRLKLPGKLLLMSVSDKCLKLSETNLSVKVEVSQSNGLEANINFPRIALKLSSRACVSQLSADELCDMRNSLLNSWLFHTPVVSDPHHQTTNISEIYASDPDDTVQSDGEHSPGPDQTIDPGKKSVRVSEHLPDVILNESEQIRVLRSGSDHCYASVERLSGDMERLNEALRSPVDSEPADTGVGCINLYTGDPAGPCRALLLRLMEDLVELFLVDRGQTVLCDLDELTGLPPSLRGYPPSVLRLKTELRLNQGEVIDAKFTFDKGLELVIE